MSRPDPNAAGSASTPLSQDEVDLLLSQMAAESSPQTALGLEKDTNTSVLQHFDFGQPVFLSTAELRKLRVHHENFIRSLAARLSVYLRMDCGLQLCGLTALGFQKFVDSLPAPAHLTLFRVEPLPGTGIIQMSPRFGLPLVDRLLGGPGLVGDVDRDLSEIEIALLDQINQMIISEWCTHWAEVEDLQPNIIGHESDGRFVPNMGQDVTMLAVSMEATIRDTTEQIRIAFPHHTIAPLMRKLTGEAEANSPAPVAAPVAPPKWNPKLNDVQVTVSAQWRALEMTARRLTELKPGEVLELGPDSGHTVLLCIDNLPKYQGRLGTFGQRWAVELTAPIKQTDRLKL